MQDRIVDVDVFAPIFRSESPAYDSSFILKSGGNNVVRITTESGIEGFGMTYGEPVADYVKNLLKEEIIGKDILASEDIWDAMFTQIRSSGRKGVALLGMSAIDIAVWDAKGKLLGQPVFRLLGGSNTKILCYASVGFLSMPDEECEKQSIECVEDGYKILKIKIGYDLGKNIRADYKRVERIRKAVGDDIDIIVDANGIYDAATAIRIAGMLEDLNVCLFEEPTHADDIPGLARVRSMTRIPVATGENEYTKYGCRDLVSAGALDVLQFDITRAGGYTEMMKAAAISQAFCLKLAPHFWPQFSAHVLSAASNGLYLETFAMPKGGSSYAGNQVILNQPPVIEGYYNLTEEPGTGLKYNMDYLQKYRV